jgi:flagellar FliL protein
VPFGKKAEVETLGPRLADAYLQDLYGSLAAGKGIGPNNVIDVMAVKRRLTNVTHKVLKEDQVNDVLLQVLQQRRMM